MDPSPMRSKIKTIINPPVFANGGFEYDGLIFQYLTEDHIKKGWLDWINDEQNTHFLNRPHSIESSESLRSYLHDVWKSGAFFFAVNKQGKYIANVKVFEVDRLKSSFSFGRFVGDNSFRGDGVGRSMTEFVCSFGYCVLGLEHVWTEVFEDNVPSIKSNLATGLRVRDGYSKSYKRQGVDKRVILMEAFLNSDH